MILSFSSGDSPPDGLTIAGRLASPMKPVLRLMPDER
jgi:hypothetical protein